MRTEKDRERRVNVSEAAHSRIGDVNDLVLQTAADKRLAYIFISQADFPGIAPSSETLRLRPDNVAACSSVETLILPTWDSSFGSMYGISYEAAARFMGDIILADVALMFLAGQSCKRTRDIGDKALSMEYRRVHPSAYSRIAADRSRLK